MKQLNELRTLTGIDSFKFDAGEVFYLPADFKSHQELASPNEYAQHYVKMIYDNFGSSVEVRVGRWFVCVLSIRLLIRRSKKYTNVQIPVRQHPIPYLLLLMDRMVG